MMEQHTKESIDLIKRSGTTIYVDQDSKNPLPSQLSQAPDTSTQSAGAAEEDYEYITGLRLYTLMASISLVYFLMMLDMSIIVTAIPHITSNFHSLNDVGWYGSAYLLTICALQPTTGKIYSNYGSKYTFLSFLGLFELGSVLCGAAQSSAMLIVGRAVAGMGASGLSNGALTIIGASASSTKRPVIMGISMAIGQFGSIGGPLIGGALTEYASWRWCFYINLPIGALSALFLLLIRIPDRLYKTETEKATLRSTLSKLDLIGFFWFAPFIIMFLMALEWGGTKYAWNSATIISLFCGAGAELIIFLAWEHHKGDEAMVPFSMIRMRIVGPSCLVIAFFFGGLLLFSYYLPIYFQAVKGASPAMSGVYLLPGIVSQMIIAALSGILVGRLGYYLPWSIASGATIAIASGLVSTFTPHTYTGKWVGYQILAGFGRGCGLQMPIIAIQNILPPEKIPVGMSLVVFWQTFGGTLFLTFGELVFSSSLLRGLQKYAPTVDPQAVITAGATSFRNIVSAEDLPGVLEAYNTAINHDFYLAVGAAVGAFVCCFRMGWYNIKKKKVTTPEA